MQFSGVLTQKVEMKYVRYSLPHKTIILAEKYFLNMLQRTNMIICKRLINALYV